MCQPSMLAGLIVNVRKKYITKLKYKNVILIEIISKVLNSLSITISDNIIIIS